MYLLHSIGLHYRYILYNNIIYRSLIIVYIYYNIYKWYFIRVIDDFLLFVDLKNSIKLNLNSFENIILKCHIK